MRAALGLAAVLFLGCTGTAALGGTDGGGSEADGGTRDADSGPTDAGGADSGLADAGGADAGPADAGGTDAGPGDAAAPCQPTLGQMMIAPPAGSMPAPGVPVVIPETGVAVRRISSLSDPGVSESQFTNGYSRWSPANVTGEYVTAFGGSRAVVYRLSDRSIVRILDVTEPNELHWDTSGTSGTETRIYYRLGTTLWQIDALTGAKAQVHDFASDFANPALPAGAEAINGVEGAPSRDARFWVFMICDSMAGGGDCTGLRDIVTYDRQADAIVGRLSAAAASAGYPTPLPTPNFVDVAPNGDRVVLSTSYADTGVFQGPHAFDLQFGSPVRVGNTSTHSGWAWGRSGEELFVSQDDCSGESGTTERRTCDYIIAVDVNDSAGWENRVGVLSHGDLGWVGFHFGRVYGPEPRGWAFISAVLPGGTSWAANQLFFFEMVPYAQQPRIVRVSPTINVEQGYWSEAFASVDVQAQNVYWGANWNGTAPLELYQASLCPRWWAGIPAR